MTKRGTEENAETGLPHGAAILALYESEGHLHRFPVLVEPLAYL